MPDYTKASQMFDSCFRAAVEARKKQVEIPSPFPGEGGVYYDDPWPIFEEFYRGDHWKRMGRMPGWKSQPVDNMGFVVVQSNTTALTDNKPKVEFLPVEDSDTDKARIVNAGFNYWWDKEGGLTTDALAVCDSRKFCVGWLHLYYDEDAKKQTLVSVHPENVYLDPDCTAESFFTEGPAYLIHEYVAQLGDILAKYPDASREKILAQAKPEMTWFDRIRQSFISSDYPTNPATSVVVRDLYIRDPETVEWEAPWDDETTAVKRAKKYPNGRLIRKAGGEVLEDGNAPYNHGFAPFAPIHAYPESDKFYGQGDLGNLLNPQVMVNRYNQLVYDQTVKGSGGIVLLDQLYGPKKEEITNDPVQVRVVRDVNRAMRVVSFPPPSRHMMDHINVLKASADDMAGLHDLTKGRAVPGNKTANEVSLTYESDKTRVRQAARWHARAIKRIGAMWLSNARQFGQFSWMVRIAQPDGTEASKLFTKEVLADLELDIAVADFAQLPDRQQERKELAMQLFSAQVIDAEELLKTLDWPNYQAVIARQAAAVPPPSAGAPPGAEQMPPELAAMMGGGIPPGGMPPEMPPEGMVPPESLEELQGVQGLDMGGGEGDYIDALIARIAAEEGITPEEVIAAMTQDQVMREE